MFFLLRLFICRRRIYILVYMKAQDVFDSCFSFRCSSFPDVVLPLPCHGHASERTRHQQAGVGTLASAEPETKHNIMICLFL